MNCSICLEDITKQTGCVTLSCEHVFHFRCIDVWFGKQIWEHQPQTCPCCRSEGNNLDRCEAEQTFIQDDEEEEEYEEEVEDEEDETATQLTDDSSYSDTRYWQRIGPGRWLILSANAVAHESMRALFGPLNELECEDDPSPEAARKIQAVFRGYKARQTYHDALSLLHLRA